MLSKVSFKVFWYTKIVGNQMPWISQGVFFAIVSTTSCHLYKKFKISVVTEGCVQCTADFKYKIYWSFV